MMLEANPDIRIGGGPLGSLLHIAVMRASLWIVEELLKRGADPNALTSISLNTPLHYLMATFDKFPEKAAAVAEALIKANANPNFKNSEGLTPLHVSIKQEQFKAIKWMIGWNEKAVETFDLDLKGGEKSFTPLHFACNLGYYGVADLLIRGGADPFIRNSRSKTARQSSKGYLVVSKCLKRYEDNLIKQRLKRALTIKTHNKHKNNVLSINLVRGYLTDRNSVVSQSLNKSYELDIDDKYSKLKDVVLDNSAKLHKRYNSLNTLKKEKGVRLKRAFKEITENVLEVTNVGLQIDIINSTTIIIFPEIIKTFDRLIVNCNNNLIKSVLEDTLTELKLKILGNIKTAQYNLII